MAAHAWDVNIFIWASRKSVGHKTNDLIKVHGDGTRADGRRFMFYVDISKSNGVSRLSSAVKVASKGPG